MVRLYLSQNPTDLVTLYTPEVKRSSPYVVVCLVAMCG